MILRNSLVSLLIIVRNASMLRSMLGFYQVFEKDWFAKPDWCQGALHDLDDKWS
jgi:hypothetical protein